MTPAWPTVIRQVRSNSVLVSPLLGGQPCAASNCGILVPLCDTLRISLLSVCSPLPSSVCAWTQRAISHLTPHSCPTSSNLVRAFSCRRLTIHISPSSLSPFSSLSTSYLYPFVSPLSPPTHQPRPTLEAIVVYISSPKVS